MALSQGQIAFFVVAVVVVVGLGLGLGLGFGLETPQQKTRRMRLLLQSTPIGRLPLRPPPGSGQAGSFTWNDGIGAWQGHFRIVNRSATMPYTLLDAGQPSNAIPGGGVLSISPQISPNQSTLPFGDWYSVTGQTFMPMPGDQVGTGGAGAQTTTIPKSFSVIVLTDEVTPAGPTGTGYVQFSP